MGRVRKQKTIIKSTSYSNISKLCWLVSLWLWLDYRLKSKFLILTQTNIHTLLRIPNNKNIPNTPSRCLDTSFRIDGLPNFYHWGKLKRKPVSTKLHCRLFLKTVVRFQTIKYFEIRRESASLASARTCQNHSKKIFSDSRRSFVRLVINW